MLSWNSYLLALFVFFLFSFSRKEEKQFIPPGTVRINDTLYCDETEVSNFSWREYEYYMLKKYGRGAPEYKAVLPDTMVWGDSMGLVLGAPLGPEYFYYRHSAYRDYPVVGVSYEQVLGFCKWRTEMVHMYWEIMKGIRKADDRSPYTGKQVLEYRLPSKKEFEAMALYGPDEKAKRRYGDRYNVMTFRDSGWVYASNYPYTWQVYSYAPNKLGLYNIIGNVSEMVQEKATAMGGGWKQCFFEGKPWSTRTNFHRPDSYTGFRCVCVMKK